MTHKLEGDWHSYVAIATGTPPVTVLLPDDIITIDSVNEITHEIKGRHRLSGGDKALSGSVVNVGNTFALFLEREPVGGMKRRYEGSLVAEDTDAEILVIVGTKGNHSKLVGKKTVALAGSQDNGIWVATQP
jgi:hypothetical protein